VSLIARKTGGFREPLTSSIEATVRPAGESWEAIKGKIRFDFGTVPSGYAWIFSKQDHASVGVYSAGPVSGRVLRKQLDDYVAAEPVLAGADVENVRRWWIPRGGFRRRKLHFTRGLLVGDAAGLVEPSSGEGIGPALRSSEIAAGVILNSLGSSPGNLDEYSRRIDRALRPGFRVGRVWAELGFRWRGRLVGSLVRSGIGQGEWERLVFGRSSHPRLRWNITALATRLVRRR